MREGDLVTRLQEELRLRVGEHLEAGETLRAALWVARESGLSTIARISRWQGAPEGLLGFGGAGATMRSARVPEGRAGELHRHLPDPETAGALALTDTRLLLLGAVAVPSDARPVALSDRLRLAGRRVLGRAEPDPLPPLTSRWECPRTALAAVGVSDPEGTLTLDFVDGSSLSVAAPAMLAVRFEEAARRSG
ncbi:hypothetical protein [Actinoplanes utahensis]|uniref:Uncharacterized protein n=1 Tax=Actinoplanes utahensis TaxID=1869 RepID=A0A0A6X9N1_ACTUT|nr:hypothetical protein [Actinoplanes utahensis]KHD76782.1 hypothetical protein MB27_14575 [Actinoplanes utahensis]GIF33334.1 hypothetical protein Aut01nite_63200 [Actinoplanes utahensis]